MRRGNERDGRPDSAKEDGIRMRAGKDRQAVLKGLSIFIDFVKSINIDKEMEMRHPRLVHAENSRGGWQDEAMHATAYLLILKNISKLL